MKVAIHWPADLRARRSFIVLGIVHRLDPLRIVGREARKDADANDRDQPVKPGRTPSPTQGERFSRFSGGKTLPKEITY